MKSSLFVSLLSFLLLLSSCAPGIRSGCRKERNVSVPRTDLPSMIPYAGTMRKYHMQVSFGKRDFSGILLLRQQGDTSRILFTTHFGMTLFDLEMDANSHTLHQCIPPLNKKKLFALLQQDFAVLFGQKLKEENTALTYLCGEPSETIVYKLKTPGAKGYYRKRIPKGRIDRITAGSALTKATFELNQSAQSEKDSVSVSHPLLRLRFTMTAF